MRALNLGFQPLILQRMCRTPLLPLTNPRLLHLDMLAQQCPGSFLNPMPNPELAATYPPP